MRCHFHIKEPRPDVLQFLRRPKRRGHWHDRNTDTHSLFFKKKLTWTTSSSILCNSRVIQGPNCRKTFTANEKKVLACAAKRRQQQHRSIARCKQVHTDLWWKTRLSRRQQKAAPAKHHRTQAWKCMSEKQRALKTARGVGLCVSTPSWACLHIGESARQTHLRGCLSTKALKTLVHPTPTISINSCSCCYKGERFAIPCVNCA